MRRVHTRRRSPPLFADGATGSVPVHGWSSVGTSLAQAQAYCGPGHGQRWPVDPGIWLPAVVELMTPGGLWDYRLLVHPRTLGPARDHQGRYPYLPVALGAAEAYRGDRPDEGDTAPAPHRR